MIKISSGNKEKFMCTAPVERRISVFPQGRQWVIEFTICDEITHQKLDELLTSEALTFTYYDDITLEEIRSAVFDGYIKINSASIKYGQDMSCTAFVQLGKEIISNVG